jgi:hypothetical protein
VVLSGEPLKTTPFRSLPLPKIWGGGWGEGQKTITFNTCPPLNLSPKGRRFGALIQPVFAGFALVAEYFKALL